MTTTAAKLVYPKGGIIGSDGKVTAAGLHYLSQLGDRLANQPVSDASGLLAGEQTAVYASSIWDTMAPLESSGAGAWSPDLTQKLHFKRTVTGVSSIGYPTFSLDGPQLFYDVEIIQGAGGGWTVTFDGIEGDPPDILTGAGDRTFMGFQLTGPATYIAWLYKAIQA
jgi:hypothetical protein